MKPDEDMVAAFEADDRRKPLYQYHSCNLLWARPGVDSATHPDTAGTEHGIPLSAEDREALMGYTFQYTADLEEAMKAAREEAMQDSPPTTTEVQTKRKHCIGQGWHLPSVTALLVIALAQILPVGSSAAPPLSTWQQEHWMEPRSMPLSQQEHIFHTAIGMLAPLIPPEDILHRTYRKWMAVDLGPLQRYELWRQEFSPNAPRGMDRKALGARGVQGRQAKAGQQGSLLSPWLRDPTQHFEQATELQHPLAGNPSIEADLWYPISAAATLG